MPQRSEMGYVMSWLQKKCCVCRFSHPHGYFICFQPNFLFLISLTVAVQAELVVWFSILRPLQGLLRLPIFILDCILSDLFLTLAS